MDKFKATVYYTYCVTFDNIEANSYEDAADKACDMGAKCKMTDLDFVDYQNCEIARLDADGHEVDFITME